MFNYRLEYEIETDKKYTYVFACIPVTQERAERMNADIEESGGVEDKRTEDVIASYAFSSIKCNGTEVGWREVPVELFDKATTEHPSFRFMQQSQD